MGIAIGVVAVAGILACLAWALRQPTSETTMGMENQARREAKKAEKRKDEGSEG